jgi:hypothetical protein
MPRVRASTVPSPPSARGQDFYIGIRIDPENARTYSFSSLKGSQASLE